LNATIQALANLHAFRSFFIDALLPDVIETAGAPPSQKIMDMRLRRRDTMECMRTLTERNLVSKKEQHPEIYLSLEMHKVFRVLVAARWKSARPYGLLRAVWNVAPQFANYQQQDAQEFLSILRDGVHAELTGILKNHIDEGLRSSAERPVDDSIVSRCYEGELQTEIHCPLCQATSTTSTTFLELLLSVPNEASGEPVTQTTLNQCFEQYFIPDPVEYRCDACRQTSQTHKRLTIAALPEILVICIKRFTYSRFGYPFKVKTDVRFPLRDLTDFHQIPGMAAASQAAGPYRLRSLIAHHGRGIDRGHYTALVYSDLRGRWLHFDDHRIDVLASDLLVYQTGSPYLLFYERAPV
jgi:ubiquitin C-terminal hydrolase